MYVADVAAHVIGPNKAKFGSVAAELWSEHMQWAEGPRAFEQGYQYLRKLFAQDPPRLEYLEELYNSPERHMFGAVRTCVSYPAQRMSLTLTCLPRSRVSHAHMSPIACLP